MRNTAVECGAAKAAGVLEIAGERTLCDAGGALYFPSFGLLAVSDLHLEKGAAFARRGRMLPPYDTADTLGRLAAAIEAWDPRVVVSLGDSFHDADGAAAMPEPFFAELSAMMAGRDWFWVAGNHDPEPPRGLGGESVCEVAFGPLAFRHEPSTGAAAGEVAGHLHPGARIVRHGRSVRRRCFASDGRRMIMPAFGAYTGMLNVLDRAFAGLFDRSALTAYMLGSGRIYPLSGALLQPG